MEQVILPHISALTDVLRDKKVLLVCGNSFDKLDIAAPIRALNPVYFRDFSPNPLYEDVCKGVELFRSSHCDAILAIGGGSAMDVAKCIKLFAPMDASQNYLTQPYADSGILLCAIPTTAGTGSESTRHAVIYYGGEKQSVSHLSLVPDYACLVPSVLRGLPLYQKKCTMLDALCQAIESWWSVNSTAESIDYSAQAIRLIVDNWQSYIEAGSPEAAQQILLAANYAGRAISITATTAPHAMSYKLTSLYSIPHGHAVALCLPQVWHFLLSGDGPCNDTRGLQHVQDTLAALPIDVCWFEDLLAKLELSRPVSSNKAADLELLSDSVNPVRLKNNPILPDKSAIKAMYERIVL